MLYQKYMPNRGDSPDSTQGLAGYFRAMLVGFLLTASVLAIIDPFCLTCRVLPH
jgi:hypothetical protein